MLPVLAGQAREQATLGDRIRDLMIDDELVLGVDGHLDVIAHISDPAAAHGHGTGVGVGEGDLGLVALFDAPLQAFVILHALFQEPDLLFQLLSGELALIGFLSVVGIHLIQVGFDPLVDVFEGALELTIGEIAPRELTALNFDLSMANQVPAEEIQVPTEGGEGPTHLLDHLCLRKLAMVLKSGASLPVSHMTSTLRLASRSKVRLPALAAGQGNECG